MTSLTPEENALVAYALLDEANSMIANNARAEGITRDIARAQVYATLATARPKPSRDAIVEALDAALTAEGYTVLSGGLEAAAEAVRGLL